MAATTDIRFHDFVESGDLGFNKMLLKITRQIEPEELRRLKFLCRGPSGLSTREIDRLTTAEDFFTSLQRLQMLTRDNLLLLQELLRCLERADLLRIVEEYAKILGNTLYFYEAPDQPANGFIHARFHVAGNLERFQRSKLDDLRAYVSRLLNEPQEFIFLVGVEKGSVNLMFMISEQYADQLKDLFEKHKDSFSRFGVDGIFVADKPAIDERSLDLPTAHEQRYRDSSTRECYGFV
ncbi:poly [ADP-ribose] polymerase [Plakobranchus ocellatus]|uniref:Poly [ADP-ribose] polymerase n=1 Tax=Plakobranchus ocellatus TaxID=259542 RepID=A0AAV4AX84_9GAST|nr:poly [ADP-ribose] polymerase [Plakobranchus ocellatus]